MSEDMEDFLEHIDTIADTGVDARLDIGGTIAALREMRCQLAFEMDPIDGPRVFLVGAVGVRFPRG